MQLHTDAAAAASASFPWTYNNPGHTQACACWQLCWGGAAPASQSLAVSACLLACGVRCSQANGQTCSVALLLLSDSACWRCRPLHQAAGILSAMPAAARLPGPPAHAPGHAGASLLLVLRSQPLARPGWPPGLPRACCTACGWPLSRSPVRPAAAWAVGHSPPACSCQPAPASPSPQQGLGQQGLCCAM